jgi:hypothetical protein
MTEQLVYHPMGISQSIHDVCLTGILPERAGSNAAVRNTVEHAVEDALENVSGN